jgi:hypothetical protein
MNIQQHRTPKFGEKLAPIPKTDVRASVVRKGSARPKISDMDPQPIAPTIIWVISEGIPPLQSPSGQTHPGHGRGGEEADNLM